MFLHHSRFFARFKRHELCRKKPTRTFCNITLVLRSWLLVYPTTILAKLLKIVMEIYLLNYTKPSMTQLLWATVNQDFNSFRDDSVNNLSIIGSCYVTLSYWANFNGYKYLLITPNTYYSKGSPKSIDSNKCISNTPRELEEKLNA